MSHIDSNIISRFMLTLTEKYGEIAKITIMWGKIHKHIRITIYYYLPGKVTLYMVEYIVNMLDDIPEEIKG